ncbi:MAG: endonuclease III domain-containing protein [Candidatus Binataceae bacterium]
MIDRKIMTQASAVGATTTAATRRRKLPALSRTNVGRALAILRRAAPAWNAPVLTLMAGEGQDPFRILIGCVLSLRTKDETTAVAASRLFARAATPAAILDLEAEEIERLIFPVGFYRTKARVIRGISRDLLKRHDGHVPDNLEQLLSLDGVGRKTANLVVTQAFNKPGICVDTHVHRITNRWGLAKTRTPEKTEAALRKVLPRRYWREINGLLVAFGQTLCQPVSPWCSRCPLSHLCPRTGVERAR